MNKKNFPPLQYITSEAKRQLKYFVVPAEKQKQDAIRKFLAQPDNPVLVSFPRTGSHWLRMMMELYFQRPQLALTFYYPERSDYLIYHTHDMELDVQRRNVVYLYREPVATIYSQMQYHNERLDAQNRVLYWAELYAQHLTKWLIEEKFTQKKVVVAYERLRSKPHAEFSKITSFFGMGFDQAQFDNCVAQISKEKLKEKTSHDAQVVNLSVDYETNRQHFKDAHSDFIWKALANERETLVNFLTNKFDDDSEALT
jgi:hypothetical protein